MVGGWGGCWAVLGAGLHSGGSSGDRSSSCDRGDGIRDGAEHGRSAGGRENVSLHHHDICFIGDSHAVRLSRVSHSFVARIGHLHIGFQANSDCAQNGLGLDMKGDGRWLRSKVRDMLSAVQAPDFAVISMGGGGAML